MSGQYCIIVWDVRTAVRKGTDGLLLRSAYTCHPVFPSFQSINPSPPLPPHSKVACGVLIGMQEGGGVESGSTAAIGLNSGLLATKLLYAVYLTAIRPQVGMPEMAVFVSI